MQTIRGIYQDGAVHLVQPVYWPEGVEVEVQLADPDNREERTFDGGFQSDDPASIAAWIASVDALPAVEMSSEAEAEWQAARARQREHEKAHFADRIPTMGPDPQ